jgi:hypothetical protein
MAYRSAVLRRPFVFEVRGEKLFHLVELVGIQLACEAALGVLLAA